MTPADDILALAERYAAEGLAVMERGKRDGFDPTAEALEAADIARILRLAATEMRSMPEGKQQDYAARLRFAVYQRTDDSPVTSSALEDHP